MDIQALRSQLNFGTVDEQYQAIMALGDYGQPAIEAVPELIALLFMDRTYRDQSITSQSADCDLGWAAFEALRKIDYTTAIVQLSDSRISRWLIKVPDLSEKIWTILLEALENKDVNVRRSATKCLKAFRSSVDQVIPVLIGRLNDEAKVQLPAIDLLGEFGTEAKSAVPHLLSLMLCGLEALVRHHPDKRSPYTAPYEAFYALRKIDLFGTVDYLKNHISPVALHWLAGFFYSDVSLVDFLITQSGHSETEIRQAAVANLSGFRVYEGKDYKQVVIPVLVEKLADSSVAVRIESIRSLAEYGRAAGQAVDKLADLLRSTDTYEGQIWYSQATTHSVYTETVTALTKILPDLWADANLLARR